MASSAKSTSTRVLVIGCGIAGPVLAIFLKRKGYDPILFDRLDGVQDAGISLMLQPNGLKVLSLVPGLLDKIYSSQVGLPIGRLGFFSLASSPPSTLGIIDNVSSSLLSRYGHGMFGVRRTAFHQALVGAATEEGIEVRWGRQLEGLEEVENEVVVRFASGESDRGSFVVGCDGLHSGTRIALFGKESPSYTGLVQVAGYSPTPESLREKPMMANIYNIVNHMITYPISPTHSCWAISGSGAESKESWRSIDEKRREEIKSGPWSEWGLGAGELVKHSEKVLMYGLYDRPKLEKWYKGRVVLLGDAAHPTTPHLGQGANQAFEDVYHLVLALTKHHPSPSTPPTNTQLSNAYAAYESIRLPRSAALVEEARSRGGTRVVANEEAAHLRDTMVQQRMSSADGQAIQDFDYVASGPFEGESELVLA